LIYGIIGRRGNGKTLLMTWFLLEFIRKHNVKVLTNYTLYGVPYEYMREPPLKAQEFLESIQNKLVGFDELQNWANCRKSMSKDNQHINAVASLSRHAKSHIFYTTQSLMKIDKILRFETDYIIQITSALKLKSTKYPKGVPMIITFEMQNMETGKKIRRTIDVRKVLKHYDTYEIMPLPEGNEERGAAGNGVVKKSPHKKKEVDEFESLLDEDPSFEGKLSQARRSGRIKKGV
jgi:hypothetical protein